MTTHPKLTEIEIPADGEESAISPVGFGSPTGVNKTQFPPSSYGTAGTSLVSSLEPTKPRTPESDGVCGEVMEPEGMVDPETKVEKVAEGGAGTANILPIFSTICKPEEFDSVHLDKDNAQMIAKQSIMLQILRSPVFLGEDSGNGIGQASVVVDRDGVRRAVTAKHVLQKKKIEGHWYNSVGVRMGSPGLQKLNAPLFFDDLNCDKNNQEDLVLRDEVTWDMGKDIAWSNPFTAEGFGKKEFVEEFNKTFPADILGDLEMVREEFQFEEGQLIGLVVYNRYNVKPNNSTVTGSSFCKSPEGTDPEATQGTEETEDKKPKFSEEELERIYGPAQAIVIHRGKISYVGEHHIEYAINTYPGCSGAVVFLLDDDMQPASVYAEDRGKAIAVHGGKHPSLGDVSIAFKF